MSTEFQERSAAGRRGFDFVEGYVAGSVLAAFEMSGLMAQLQADSLTLDDFAASAPHEPEARALAAACFAYLSERALVEEDSGRYRLTEYGQEVCEEKGYLVWAVGGYGGALRHLDVFLAGTKRYGTDYGRDGRWVANGAALLGGKDMVPHAMRLLETVSFNHVVDLGCGNARFLLTLCSRFGANGTGVDISPEACAEAQKMIRDAGQQDRVNVVEGNAAELATIPGLADTDLLVTFFLLHEIYAQGWDFLVKYLRDLSGRLPENAHVLTAEVEPPALEAVGQRFTPEFTLVHALMRQRLLTADGWREAFAEGGFTVVEAVENDMPGGILILAQRTAS
jgi:SAM-dependent methyltransferase